MTLAHSADLRSPIRYRCTAWIPAAERGRARRRGERDVRIERRDAAVARATAGMGRTSGLVAGRS